MSIDKLSVAMVGIGRSSAKLSRDISINRRACLEVVISIAQEFGILGRELDKLTFLDFCLQYPYCPPGRVEENMPKGELLEVRKRPPRPPKKLIPASRERYIPKIKPCARSRLR